MRGSVYYQSTQLVKQVFQESAKKEEKINPNHPNYEKVSSYSTMKSYRSIWENLFNYLKEHFKMKDFEQIEEHHISEYMNYKIEYYPSKQYLEKISSAIGKLEIALKNFAKNIHFINKDYDFSIRKTILNEARDLKLVASNYHNRAYRNPLLLIEYISNPIHQIAAKVQLEGGARIEGVALIKEEQLRGIIFDDITQEEKGSLWTKEKGGKEGNILISINTYIKLSNFIKENHIFKIDREKYYNDLKEAILKTKEKLEASHGLRWNFCKRRMFEYAKANYTYQDSLEQVSNEMKHNRASITQHYLY